MKFNFNRKNHALNRSKYLLVPLQLISALGIACSLTIGIANRTTAQLVTPTTSNTLGNCIDGILPCPFPYPDVSSYETLQGNDNAYSTLIGGDLSINETAVEMEGRIFVYGDLTIDKPSFSPLYNVGFVGVGSFVVPDDLTDYLTVGGDINLAAGMRMQIGGIASGVFGANPPTPDNQRNARGNLRHKGTITSDANAIEIISPGQIIPDPTLDLSIFDAIFSEWNTRSACLADEVSNPQSANVDVHFNGFEVRFRSADGASGLYVINIDQDIANNSGGNTSIVFDNFPNDATILINVDKSGSGDTISILSNNVTGLSDQLRERIFWNFPDATNVTFGGFSQFFGSVLIPNRSSTTTVSVPGINGRFLAGGDVIHQGTGAEFHSFPFRGDLSTAYANCGTTSTYSISGTLYKDTNGNNTFDSGTETGLGADVTVTLYTDSNNNNVIDSGEQVGSPVVTNSNGEYTFTGVSNGTYKVQVDTTDTDIPSGFTLGTPNDLTVTINSNSQANINFGFDELSNISGTLYKDTNGNDTFDSGTETGLGADVTVTLYTDSNNNNVIDSGEQVGSPVVTNSNGEYTFTGVSKGTYKVQVDTTDTDIPSGFTLGTPNDLTVTVSNSDITDLNFGFDEAVPGNPILLLVKRITAINGIEFNDLVDDGTSSDDNNANWPSSFLRGVIDGGVVKPEDELEYTIYFLSSGDTAVTNVKFCDLIPESVTFIPYSFTGLTPTDGGLSGADSGINLTIGNNTTYLTNVEDTDRGEYFRAGKTPSATCSANNTNGALVVNIVNSGLPAPNNELPNATAPATPTNSYGFVRFRAKVK